MDVACTCAFIFYKYIAAFKLRICECKLAGSATSPQVSAIDEGSQGKDWFEMLSGSNGNPWKVSAVLDLLTSNSRFILVFH